MHDDNTVDFGSGGSVVKVNETFAGNDRTKKPKHSSKGRGRARKVLALVDRKTGAANSMVLEDLKAETLLPILKESIVKEATV